MNSVSQEFNTLLDTLIKSKDYYTSQMFEFFPYGILGLYLDKSGPKIWYLNSSFLQLTNDSKSVKSGSVSRFFKTLSKKTLEEAGITEANRCVSFDAILKVKDKGIIEVYITGKTFMIEGQTVPHFLGAVFQSDDLEANEERTLKIIRNFSDDPQFGSASIINAAQVIKENIQTLRQTTLKWSDHFKTISEPDFDTEEDA